MTETSVEETLNNLPNLSLEDLADLLTIKCPPKSEDYFYSTKPLGLQSNN